MINDVQITAAKNADSNNITYKYDYVVLVPIISAIWYPLTRKQREIDKYLKLVKIWYFLL